MHARKINQEAYEFVIHNLQRPRPLLDITKINSALQHCLVENKVKEAEDILNACFDKGVVNIDFVNTMVDVYGPKYATEAYKLFKRALKEKNAQPDETTYVQLLDILFKSGNLNDCMKVATRFLEQTKIKPTPSIYTPYILSLLLTSNFETAIALLDDPDVQIDSFLMNVQFNYLSSHGGVDILQNPELCGINELKKYSVYYALLMRQKDSQIEPMKILKLATEHGVQLNSAIIYNYMCAIEFSSQEIVEQVLDLMRTIRIDEPIVQQFIRQFTMVHRTNESEVIRKLFDICTRHGVLLTTEMAKILVDYILSYHLERALITLKTVNQKTLWDALKSDACEKVIKRIYYEEEEIDHMGRFVEVLVNYHILLNDEYSFMVLELLHEDKEYNTFKIFLDYSLRKGVINRSHIRAIVNMVQDLSENENHELLISIHNMIYFNLKPFLLDYWRVLIKSTDSIQDLCHLVQDSLSALPKTVENVKTVTHLFMDELGKKSQETFKLHRHTIKYLRGREITDEYLDSFYILVHTIKYNEN